VWQFVDYQLAEVPEALMRAKEKELSESLQGTAQLSAESQQAAAQLSASESLQGAPQ
jgi:hypothetical protein